MQPFSPRASTAKPEFALIDWLRQRVTDRPPVTLGIGDDAAVLSGPAERPWLVAADMLLQDVHFTLSSASPEQIGRKALAVNLSDIAAMGGRPFAAFCTVALPKSLGDGFARAVHAGLIQLADEYQVILAGGDTNTWAGPLVISVTVVGESLGPQPLTRAGAQPGDWLFVTGELGGSLQGHHLTFQPRIAEVREILAIARPSAMLDISDGLAADLYHLLEASHVAARIEEAGVPIRAELLAAKQGRSHAGLSDSLYHAFSDGEDFELLFTLPPDDGQRLLAEWSGPTRLTRIGEIVAGTPQAWRIDATGAAHGLPAWGWSHGFL